MTHRLYRCLSILVLLLTPVPGSHAQDDARLANLLQPVIAPHEGNVAVAIKHLSTGASFQHRADVPMPTASLIKFPVMVAAYQSADDGKLDLKTPVELKEADKVPGSGILTSHFTAGTRLSVRDAIRLMIVYSDNTATNLVVDQIGLPATTELMTRWEYPNTRLHAKVFRGDTSIAPERSRQFGLGSTTAGEMLRLLAQLDQKVLVSADASKEMYDHLLACEDKPRLAKGLPKGIKVALKTGSVGGIRTVAGIIESPSGHIAICVLTSNNKDQTWTDENAGVALCAEISRKTFEHFNPVSNPTTVEPSRELAQGAGGELVEALQRTLNHRMPSAQLSVDGDFGPVTGQAVMAFQRSQNLPATGIVGPETWKALGPLLLSIDNGPIDMESVNNAILPKSPEDPISGPPYVTAKAWAIGEAKTGRLLWESKGQESREIASTTKSMTAWLVLREAATNPKLLDEVVTFSAAADKTPGSTAGIKTGEMVSVRELIYGLMLPSGNDASVALAEHVGPRFAADDDTAEAQQPIARFVAEMNRTARELGMTQTHYANPHGLPEASHLSTAADQLILGSKVMQSAAFREYVQTRQHAARVEGPGGYTRHVLWKNGNQLLEITGYSGVKTGTTDAAGACLVSAGSRQDDELIVVVLGSSSNEGRYVDTRNLFRWAWQQRAKSD